MDVIEHKYEPHDIATLPSPQYRCVQQMQTERRELNTLETVTLLKLQPKKVDAIALKNSSWYNLGLND